MSEIFAGISFRKVWVFTINRKELCHTFHWKFERLNSYFSQIAANKNMFKVDGKKDTRTVSVIICFSYSGLF